ncbi:MAG TPA: RHS repeat-associated core domain-containing protein, partial [Thermoleophilia bacterium]|nr:RHS repeat-associated core domain-containing protein [Thermoleophilia bacterium]
GSFGAASSRRDGDGLLTGIDELMLTRHPAHGLVTNAAAGLSSTAFTHNGYGEVERADSGALLSVAYLRDGLGRITEKTESRAGATSTVRYRYDDAGRLAQEDVDGAVTSFAYDDNGNRLQAGAQSCEFDDRDRLAACGGTIYDYNDDGQLAARDDAGAVTSYEYDARGGLRRVVLPDATDVEYLLDATGRRVGKMIDGVLVRQWLWSDALKIAAELDGAGEPISRFVYGTRANVPDLVIQIRFDPEIGEERTTYRVIHDHLGSPLFVVDIATGEVVAERAFDAWGNTLVDTNPGFIPFGFAGGLEDVDTGLVRFGARDYLPEVGRWATPDPISFAGGDPNRYAYVANDPINNIDPSGHAVQVVLFGVVIGLAEVLELAGISSGLACISNPQACADLAEQARQMALAIIAAMSGVGTAATSVAIEAVRERMCPSDPEEQCRAIGNQAYRECVNGLGPTYGEAEVTFECDAIGRLVEEACRTIL